MLAFEDYAEREQAWQTFINHPEWDKMKNIPKYKGTVSNITDLILTPMGYSQI
jgi:hypothetical protein